MAKDVKTAVQESQGKPPAESATLPPAKDPAAELAQENARLKAELAELKAKLARPDAMPAHPAELAAHVHAPGRLALYEVELPGFKSRLCVCPHCKAEQMPQPAAETECPHCGTAHPYRRAGRQPCHNEKCERKVFDAAPMVECNACERRFKLSQAPAKIVERLQVPALSPGDAFERFKQYNGIIGTTQKPTIGLVAGQAG